MRRCLELAEHGRGFTSPNPMVGSVIVHNNKIIGEGWHRKYGEAHAEVNAVNSVNDKSLLKTSTLYVSLEPCAHVGKTPACSRMIIENRIPKVIVGCRDSFEKVDGKGIAQMRQAGIDVKVGLLEKESRELNARFFTFHEKKRPYIILKWAQTTDGYIDFKRTPETPIGPNWITDEYARIRVHKWRAEEDAILVGTNTAEKDNPKLNVRSFAGKNPLRILLDRNLRLPKELALFDGSTETLVFNEIKSENKPMCEYIKVPSHENVFDFILKTLYARDIQSLIVEGGAKLINSILERNLWDEARVFVGDNMFVSGVEAPRIKKYPKIIERGTQSNLYFYFNGSQI
jgi:diaminohydroxyphosphoribosylaminopyrimidine deaminase/5-amino-6-(5-phosphoribosylamino)uracil reductase